MSIGERKGERRKVKGQRPKAKGERRMLFHELCIAWWSMIMDDHHRITGHRIAYTVQYSVYDNVHSAVVCLSVCRFVSQFLYITCRESRRAWSCIRQRNSGTATVQHRRPSWRYIYPCSCLVPSDRSRGAEPPSPGQLKNERRNATRRIQHANSIQAESELEN